MSNHHASTTEQQMTISQRYGYKPNPDCNCLICRANRMRHDKFLTPESIRSSARLIRKRFSHGPLSGLGELVTAAELYADLMERPANSLIVRKMHHELEGWEVITPLGTRYARITSEPGPVPRYRVVNRFYTDTLQQAIDRLEGEWQADVRAFLRKAGEDHVDKAVAEDRVDSVKE